MPKMPNFLIIGAHKAGTTSLYRYLSQHPQLFMSAVKEPHFFSFMGHPLDFNDPNFNPTKLRSVSTIQEYQSLFQHAGDAIAIGEASPSYLYVAQSATKIYEYLPTVKLIAILRNPADRAYSNFMHCRARKHKEPLEDFSEALKAEAARIKENWSPLWHYQQMGFYYQQLQRYYQLFSKEQIQIHLYDDFQSNPKAMLQSIFHFLEVSPDFEPDLTQRHNVSGIPKNKLWRAAFQYLQWTNPFLPIQMRQKLKERVLTRPPFPSDIRKQLIALFREDILQLQDLIHRDLTQWLVVE